MKDKIHPKYFPCKVFHNGELVMTVGATHPRLILHHAEKWGG
jgi:ribosomal protein L31